MNDTQRRFLDFLDNQLVLSRDVENSTPFDFYIFNNIQEEEAMIGAIVWSIEDYSPQEFCKRLSLKYCMPLDHDTIKELLLQCPIEYLIHII